MGGNQHGAAFVAQLPQQLDDARFGLHVDAGEGFIQQNNFSLLSDSAGQKHALFLPAGKLADLALPVLAHADSRQGGIDNLMVARFSPPQPAHMAVAPHHHHIFHQHRERPVHLFRLRNVGDEVLPQGAVNRLAEDRDIAFTDAHKAHQRFKQRRFARTVHPDQRGDGAARHAERGVAQGSMTVAIGHADIVDRETR